MTKKNPYDLDIFYYLIKKSIPAQYSMNIQTNRIYIEDSTKKEDINEF